MKAMTERQKSVLSLICRYAQQPAGVPKQMALANDLGIHVSSLREHLQALEKKKAITRKHYEHRGIRVNWDNHYAAAFKEAV